ncbi:MAG: RHS repeat-associated core domain-containing protein [Verrucomicrobiota bacterium]|jgi:RHS repeat-associated protein
MIERNYSRPDPFQTSVTNEFYPTGLMGRNYGSRVYAAGYGYDYAGRMKTMTNWSNFISLAGGRVTMWAYDGYRGFLTNKVYADGQGPVYTYTAAGRLQSRIWARGTNTTYGYNGAGDLNQASHNDGTPGVATGFDRRGWQIAVTNGVTVCVQTYNDAGQLLSESYTGGPLNGLAITNGYDNLLRRTNLTVYQSNNLLIQQCFTFDAASRLSSVSDGNGNSAAYSYVANSPLVGQILFTNNGVLRMTTTKQYDSLNRLTQISSVGGASSASPISFNYNYNNANQRTRSMSADNSYWSYNYDALGQVTNGVKYFADGTLVPGQQFGYLFDTIGNRTQTKAGGDASGSSAALRAASYSVNSLNQITSRDHPGTNDIIGVALATNGVTVNGQTAWRKGEYFWSTIKSNNTAASQWEGVTVASGSFTNLGNLLVPQTPQAFTYDADGNQTSDGLWTNVWDAENRLISSTSLTNVPPAGRMKEDWSYLTDGRWSQRIVSSWNGSAYVPQYTNRFVWDGKVLLAILDQTNGLVMSFLRGLDLSSTMQGTGGAGGLLAVSFKTNGTHFAAFDGNGNVAGLVSAADGTTSANYDYDPFGQTIRITGSVGKLNPIRFSTQYADDVKGTIKYLYRDYTPSTGTWLNRDPLEEEGSINLYNFIENMPTISIDGDGRVNSFSVKFSGGRATTCGGWSNSWTYTGNFDNSYWLVQEITIIQNYTDCSGKRFKDKDNWFEAIQVTTGPFSADDTDIIGGIPNSTGLGESVTGVIKLVLSSGKYGKDVASWGHQVPAAGPMNSTYTKPSWWSKVGLVIGARNSFEKKWNCCCAQHDNGNPQHSP